jgi:hypothetical protein
MKLINNITMSSQLYHKVITYALDKNNGKRLNIPKQKASRCIDQTSIKQYIPELLQFYDKVSATISEHLDFTVYPTNKNKLACIILVYEDEGDFINWHYDVNVYTGRFFTLLIPIYGFDTCTQFQYIDKKHKTQTITMSLGNGVLFEGEKLFHSTTKQCKGDTRIVIAMEFCSNPQYDSLKFFVNKIKQMFF